ncbi:HI0074, nucleotidyltransferase substrate binding protein, HI0074 family [Burkholderiaceae bacterium]|jgi:nucleotidyltransferase substrate binding protein (TIGR01987 family)
MASNKLDLSTLHKALGRLDEGYQRYLLDVRDLQIRDGLIQRYEFTYEISHKMLKRHLEMTSPNPEIFDAMPFADLIRTGNELSILKSDWSAWKLFREMRAKTSHTYDEDIAQTVVQVIPDFIHEARYLAEQLELRQI